jgi:hypothetical protein
VYLIYITQNKERKTMRNLNTKQKKMLKEMFELDEVFYCTDMNMKQYDKVHNVNPHENFDSNVDRYFEDLFNERKYHNAD